jgi:hypothetical protein
MRNIKLQRNSLLEAKIGAIIDTRLLNRIRDRFGKVNRSEKLKLFKFRIVKVMRREKLAEMDAK